MSDLTVATLLAIITSFTEALNNHTEALNNHTEALKGAPEAAEDKPKRGRKPKAEAEKPEAEKPEAEGITLQDAQAAVLEVKNKFGSDVAKEVLKDVTGQTMVAKIQPEHYEPLFNACKHVLENGAESKPTKDADEPTKEITLDEVKEAGQNLAKLGAAYKTQAVQIINEVGGASKIAEVAPENYQALQDALVEAFEQATAQSDDL